MSLTITTQPTLNKVDQVIKSVMLTYPVPYKSRMAVLKRIFLGSSGFGWDESGCPNLDYFGPLSSSMDFSDLDEQRLKVEAELLDDTIPGMALLFAGRAVALKRQYADRELVAAYVDILAKEHTQGEDSPTNALMVGNFLVGQNILHNAPFDLMDMEWALAAEEVLTAALQGIVCALGMQFDHYNPERADKRLLQIHRWLTKDLDLLDGVTGKKDKVAAANVIADRLIDEILAEDNGR
jgi:hypothetical protein